MKEIVRIMNEIQAIHPDLEAHLHCLGFAIADEIEGWKRLVEVLEQIQKPEVK